MYNWLLEYALFFFFCTSKINIKLLLHRLMQGYCVISWLQNHTLRQQNWFIWKVFNGNIHLNLNNRLTASEGVWGSCENSLGCQWKRREPMKDLTKSINSAVKTQPYPSFRAISLISQWVYGHFLSLLFVSFRPRGNLRFITRLILIFIDISSRYMAFSCKLGSWTAMLFVKGCTWWSAGGCLKTAAIWGISGSFHTWMSRHTLWSLASFPLCIFSTPLAASESWILCHMLHHSLVLHQHMYTPPHRLVAWEHFIVSVSQAMVY